MSAETRISLGDLCELRSSCAEDIDAIVKHANNPKVARHLRERFPQPYTRPDAVDWIRHTKEYEPGTILAIATPKEAIGGVSLNRQDDVYRHSAELGYWLAEPYWGRGIATRAVRAMCDVGFQDKDLARIFACIFAENIGSCRVLEKTGFTLEGIHRKAVFKNGHYVDEKMYALLRAEWQLRDEA